MKYQRKISALVLGIFLIGQFGFGGLALADDASPSPTPTPSTTPEATPSPSASPTPSASPSPAATPSPSPSPSATPGPWANAGSGAGEGAGAGAGDGAKNAGPGSSSNTTPDATQTGATPACHGPIPKYVLDTGSKKWVEADQSSFTCDLASGYFLSSRYYFDPHSGYYELIPQNQVAALPAYFMTAPQVIHTVLGDLQVGSQAYQVAKAMGLLGEGGIVVNGTGPGSSNSAVVSNSNQSWFDLTNLVNVINALQSHANTGNVTASSNTQVGNSVTGAASVVANIINLLASAWSWSNGDLNFFMQNLFGNQSGDIMLNPTETANGGGSQLGSASINNTGPNSNNTAGANSSSSLDVKAQNSGNIVNNVDLSAQSGNAGANGNTSAGNVASGNAMAEVNIINMINSFINSGSSFFGILNIFGSLNGDILFPNGFLNGLLASGSGGASTAGLSNTGPNSTNQAGVNGNNQTTVNNTVNNGVTNNINTTAASGSAGASGNTSAGNVSTGSASTNQGLFNLDNTSIFGDNAVLVIVNVLGHWVGKIVTLPGGSSEAALLTGNAQVGGNAQLNTTGPGSNNQANVNNDSVANINQNTTGSITNNVNVNAQSGNASANDNTKVGDVTTGNASAGSSVANIFNSVLNVKHWFGVLVINVFGDWVGDVGDNTPAGNDTSKGGGVQDNAAAPVAGAMPKVGLLNLAGNLINSASHSNSRLPIGQLCREPQ
jgi:hypothetical protein